MGDEGEFHDFDLLSPQAATRLGNLSKGGKVEGWLTFSFVKGKIMTDGSRFPDCWSHFS